MSRWPNAPSRWNLGLPRQGRGLLGVILIVIAVYLAYHGIGRP